MSVGSIDISAAAADLAHSSNWRGFKPGCSGAGIVTVGRHGAHPVFLNTELRQIGN